jgi:hypothetical protein
MNKNRQNISKKRRINENSPMDDLFDRGDADGYPRLCNPDSLPGR